MLQYLPQFIASFSSTLPLNNELIAKEQQLEKTSFRCSVYRQYIYPDSNPFQCMFDTQFDLTWPSMVLNLFCPFHFRNGNGSLKLIGALSIHQNISYSIEFVNSCIGTCIAFPLTSLSLK